jgi:type II secretory pathway component PulF
LRQLARTLIEDISSGEALDSAFARGFRGGQGFIASMVSAGEASGDLPGGLQRSAEILTSRLKLREQLISVLAYPTFVLVSAIGAVFVILLFIVPSIAPLAEDAGAAPPLALQILILCSDALRTNLKWLGAGAAVLALTAFLMIRAGLVRDPLETLLLDGPARRTARAIVFGGFVVSLGTMLGAGAPVTDALRLARRGVMLRIAQRRLESLVPLVRQGQPLSVALDGVKGVPPSVIRLAAVGENSNALGRMLVRSGRLEEEAALRRIESFGRIAGPALIVFLGLLLGVLMAALLSGVSQMGQSALG